jgi:two-component system, LuxR family, response regulator FixJ
MEHEVIKCLVEGKENKQIADSLGISLGMIEVHRARVLEKVHAHNLSALIRMAIAAGREQGC